MIKTAALHLPPRSKYPASFIFFIRSLYQHRDLVWQLSRREIFSRYQGSMMGVLWSFLNPLISLAIYTTFFSLFIKARWGEFEDGHANYAIILFIGLILHGFFAECVNRAPGLIAQQANYVKKVVSPLELFPCVASFSALFHLFVSLLMLLIAQVFFSHWLAWTLVFFPLILLPFFLLVLGISWFLAAVGVYLRDISQLTAIITTITLFMAPVFYPLSNLPPKIQPWLNLNPLTFVIESSRQLLFHAQLPNWMGLALYSLVSCTIAWLGFWWFQKTREGFADVL